jgi:hypothetical protein
MLSSGTKGYAACPGCLRNALEEAEQEPRLTPRDFVKRGQQLRRESSFYQGSAWAEWLADVEKHLTRPETRHALLARFLHAIDAELLASGIKKTPYTAECPSCGATVDRATGHGWLCPECGYGPFNLPVPD